MLRLRINYAKEEPLRFLSHLEMLNVFTRALRRAGLPLAYSQGFNPHPLIAFGSALAVRVTSDDEYLDVRLEKEIRAHELHNLLQKQLPEGLKIKKVKIIPLQTPALMSVINRASYLVTTPATEKLSENALRDGLQNFWDKSSVVIERVTKKGTKKLDLRPGVFLLEARVAPKEVIWNMVVSSGNKVNIRPLEPVKWVTEKCCLSVNLELAKIHRTGLYIERKGRKFSPLDYVGNEAL